MPLNEDFLNRFKVSLDDKYYGISNSRHIYKYKLGAVIKYFNSLSSNKQLELVQELHNIQREYIIKCAEKEQVEIPLPKLGRLRIKEGKKEIIRLKQEAKLTGRQASEVTKDVILLLRERKKNRKLAKKVVTPKFSI